MSEGEKACTTCGKTKLLTEFGRRKYKNTETLGYKSSCYECRRVPPETKRVPFTKEEREARLKEQKRIYREKNRERIAEKKARDAKTEHGKALDRARGERYRLAHPERVKEISVRSSRKRAVVAKVEAREKRVELSASYVAQLLKLPTAEVPEELIEAERVRIKVKRLVRKMEETRTEKKCSTCKVYRPLISFSTSPHTKDGRCYECLTCKREKRKKEALSKGLTYKPRRMDEFGRWVKMSSEELRANKNAHERMKYALNKQRKANEKHN